MKQIRINLKGLTGLIAAAMIFSACEKTFDSKFAKNSDLSNSSNVQVYMAMVNANRNYVYVESRPVNGSSMISGTAFPSAGVGFSVPGGPTSFAVRDTLSTATQVPINFAENLQGGKYYTIFVYDTITSPQQKTVTTNIVIPNDTTARVRFANFVYNPTAMPAIDIYSTRLKTNIYSNLQITDVSDFLTVPSNTVDTFIVRLTGTGTNLQNIIPPTPPATTPTLIDVRAILTPTPKRSYTVVFRGGFRTNVTTSATVRTLSAFVNY